MKERRIILATLEPRLYTTLASIKYDPSVPKKERHAEITKVIKPLVVKFYPFPKYKTSEQNEMIKHLIEYYEVVIREIAD